jgi:hypothetical protein
MELSTRSLVSIAGGLSSFTPFYRLIIARNRGGATEDPAYCLSVWLRHFNNWLRISPESVPGSVAEIGPGTTVGIGLCAIVCGARTYTGLDVSRYQQGSFTTSFLAELDRLFADKAYRRQRLQHAVTAHPKASAYVDDLAASKQCATAAWERVKQSDRQSQHGIHACRTFSPWTDPEVIEPETIDLLFSQSVLEHVDDLPAAYRAAFTWLRYGGVCSHWIDFKSHGHSIYWNGHWAMRDWEWSLHRGRKLFLLNREPLDVHLRHVEQSGFSLVDVRRKVLDQGITRKQLAPRFRALADEDLITAGAELVATKTFDATPSNRSL